MFDERNRGCERVGVLGRLPEYAYGKLFSDFELLVSCDDDFENELSSLHMRDANQYRLARGRFCDRARGPICDRMA